MHLTLPTLFAIFIIMFCFNHTSTNQNVKDVGNCLIIALLTILVLLGEVKG